MPRFNYTGRKRITRSCIDLFVKNSDDGPLLEVRRLDLRDLPLPDDASVVVEAYRLATYMRLPAGTVAEPRLPYEARLSEFEDADTPLFRIKVIGNGGDAGKLLAAADRLRARSEGEDQESDTSLLTVVPCDLGRQIWKVDCSDDAPKILVNKALGDWRSLLVEPQAVALVLPEVLRQVVAWVLGRLDDSGEYDDDAVHAWVEFMRALGHDPTELSEASEEDRALWADDIVDHFCARHRFMNVVRGMTGGADQ